MFEVADELAEDPGLVGVGHAAVDLLHDGGGLHLGPREVVDGHLSELALVDGRRVDAWRRRQLVRDREQCVETFGPGHVEVVLELWPGKVVRLGLDLHEGDPDLRPARHADQAIGEDLPLADVEGHLDERLDGARRSSHRLRDGGAELAHCAHHGEQRGRGPALLFLGPVDPRSRDQSRRVPGLFSHGSLRS